MRKTFDKTHTRLSLAIAATLLAVGFFVLSLSLVVTRARYVAEIGGGKLTYDTHTPFEVKSQSDLQNAIKSGYRYVQLSNSLMGPIIMTGNALDLQNDLTLDLNGKEIERNDRTNLVNVPTGKSLTVIDTAGGGGLYNPIGSVLNVAGGSLNLTGGTLESGPRPAEYFSNIYRDATGSVISPEPVASYQDAETIDVGPVYTIDNENNWKPQFTSTHNATTNQYEISYGENQQPLPRLALRENVNSANMYFDVAYMGDKASGTPYIARDTYAYVSIAGDTNDRFSDFVLGNHVKSYGYYIKVVETKDATTGKVTKTETSLYKGEYDESGNPVVKQEAENKNVYVKQAMFFSYAKDITASSTGEYNNNAIPNYAAVTMSDGELNIDVQDKVGDTQNTGLPGSIYSYFGTWNTSCIYITGGVMNVSTPGVISTVDPQDLPAFNPNIETRSNSAKFSEGACILSYEDTGRASSGTLNINRMDRAVAYNGSVISVSGGKVRLHDANIEKHVTLSHSDDPFAIADTVNNDSDHGSEFPADRQYRDAAVFVNGGTLELKPSAAGKTVNITVEKDIRGGLEYYGYTDAWKTGNTDLKNKILNQLTIEGVTDESGNRKPTAIYGVVPQTTFGILTRGRGDANILSELKAENTDITMHGSHSYAVFGTRGEVTLTDSSITLDSDSYSYGVAAVNKTRLKDNGESRAVKITLQNTDVYVGLPLNESNKVELNAAGVPVASTSDLTYEGSSPVNSDWSAYCIINRKPLTTSDPLENKEWFNASGASVLTGMRAASLGVYLDSSEFEGGNVTMNNSKIYSREMGVAVNGGELTFQGGGAIHAWNGSAIYLSGMLKNGDTHGKVDFMSGNYDVRSQINRQGNGGTSNAVSSSMVADAAGTHQYGMYVHWQKTDSGITEYNNENGIRVDGGSLTSYGKLSMNFRGLFNDYKSGSVYNVGSSYTNYDKVKIKSFAVACIEKEATADSVAIPANIDIRYASIKVTVGGGIKVQGGNISLGDNTTGREDIIVETTGEQYWNEEYHTSYNKTGDRTWDFCPSLSGGHAVIARGGSLTVYNGTYSAEYSSAAGVTTDIKYKKVNNETKAYVANKPIVTIYDGKFDGNLGDFDNNALGNGGPMSSYGIKIMGASEVDIRDGIFNGKNGGLYIRGTDVGDDINEVSMRATALIKAGSFGSVTKPRANYGQDGVNVSDYTDIHFGTDNSDFTSSAIRNEKLKIYARVFPIGVNTVLNSGAQPNNNINAYVYYGTYTAHGDYTSGNVGVAALYAEYVKFNIFGYGGNTKYVNKTVSGEADKKVRNNGTAPGTNTVTNVATPTLYLG